MTYLVVKSSATSPDQTAFLEVTGLYSSERSKAKEYPTLYKASNAARIFEGQPSPAESYPKA